MNNVVISGKVCEEETICFFRKATNQFTADIDVSVPREVSEIDEGPLHIKVRLLGQAAVDGMMWLQKGTAVVIKGYISKVGDMTVVKSSHLEMIYNFADAHTSFLKKKRNYKEIDGD